MNQFTRDFGIGIDRPSVIGRPKAFRDEKSAYRAAQWFRASLLGRADAQKFCDDNGLITKAANEGTTIAGGALVPTEIARTIFDLRERYGVARRFAAIQPMASDLAYIPRRISAPTGYWLSEGSSVTASQPVLGAVGLSCKKLGSLIVASSELEEDAISFAEFLTSEIAYCFSKVEDDCLFLGDGTSTYGGMTGLRKIFNDGVGSLAGSVDAATNHDTMVEIDAADLGSLIGKLPVFALPNAKWFCSQVALGMVFFRLGGVTGALTSSVIDGRTVFYYAGFEIVPTASMPTSTGDLSDQAMILFGDLELGAVIGDTREIRVARAEANKFVEDQISVRGTQRFDINVFGTGDTSNPGSIVALMGE